MNLPIPIQQELDCFKKATGNKKGFLFFGGDVFYFYDNRYCRVFPVKFSLSYKDNFIENELHADSSLNLFIWTHKEQLRIANPQEQFICNPDLFPVKVLLLYRIPYDQTRNYLHGILYLDSRYRNEIYTALYTDEKLEQAFLAMAAHGDIMAVSSTQISDDFEILADQIKRDNLKAVSEVYLQGNNIGQFLKEVE